MDCFKNSGSEKYYYLLDKIVSAKFSEEPFRHLEILDFLSEEHFNSVITSPQVAIPEAHDTENLINLLLKKGYEPIGFPGCTTSVSHYLNWLKGKSDHTNQIQCEGQGMALRLQSPQHETIIELNRFFRSDIFKQVLEKKFGIIKPTDCDTGLQKYLTGYEISPHPDIRKKALTYMLNVNPSRNSEDMDIHTHYLIFKPHKQFIREFWRYNRDLDTFWVPWEWCNTIKQQRRNNSIVIFAPTWNTLHAVKLKYNHLETQRTQFYGNLWYKDARLPQPSYEQFEIKGKPIPRAHLGWKSQLKSGIKSSGKRLLNLFRR